MHPKPAAFRTRITVESAKQLVLRRANTTRGRCPFCDAEVELVVLADGGIGEHVTLLQVQAWFSSQELHFWTNALGSTEICLPSLFQCLEQSDLSGTLGAQKDLLIPSRRKDHEDE